LCGSKFAWVQGYANGGPRDELHDIDVDVRDASKLVFSVLPLLFGAVG